MDQSSAHKSKSKFDLEMPPTLAQEQAQKPKPVAQPSPFQLQMPPTFQLEEERKPALEQTQVVHQDLGSGEGTEEYWTKGLNIPLGGSPDLPLGLEAPTAGQIWDETGKAVQGLSNFMVGEWLGNPDRIYEAFASGDKEKIGKALDGMAQDLEWQVLDVASLKAGTVYKTTKASLQLLKQSLQNLTPRQALQQTKGIVPGLGQRMGNQAWELLSYPFKREFLPTSEGMKSLADVFQPAVERLESKGLDIPFRRTQASKAITTGMGKDLGKAAAGMSPNERYQLYKAIRGLPADPAQKKLLWDWKGKTLAKGVDREYAKSFQNTLHKQMKKQFLVSDDQLFNMPAAESFVRTLDQSMHGVFDPKAVQKVLKQTIESSTVPSELKYLARDLYNLPYSTPAAVAEASKKASVSYLTSNLKRLGVVQDQLPQGAKLGDDWWLSKYPSLKSAYVPRDVELELRAIMDIPKYTQAGFLGKMNRMLLTPWKTGKVILRPASHFRNAMSNVILNDWGGLPFYRMDAYLAAAKEFKSKGKLWKEWERLSGAGGSFSVAEVENITGGMKYGSNMMDHMLSWFDQKVSVPRQVYNAEEQFFKLAKYMWNRNHGMKDYESFLDAMKWTFNYGEITRATAAIRGTVAPFYTWTSKIIPLMAETAVKHPLRFAKWPLMMEAFQAGAIEQANISNDEWSWLSSILPDYVREGAFLLVPWRDSQDRLQLLNMTYIMPGLGDMTDIMRDPSGQMLGSPFLSIAAGLKDNRRYSGAPLWYDWETPGTKWAKAGAFVWESLVPSFPLIPGTVDFEDMYDRITNTPDAPTWGQMVASQFGLRTTPINPEAMARRRQALDDIHRSEIGSRMRSELRQATSPEQARKIVENYGRLRERLEKKVSERGW